MNIKPIQLPLTEHIHTRAARAGIPLSGTFELTPCCNMACKMCYVRKTKQEQEAIAPLRTAEEWIRLGRTARDAGMLYLLLTGGEPFLRPDLRQILSRLNSLGLVITINSNGTLIDASVVDWLKQTPPARINITLYGASDETYGRLCGNPHGFSQVVRAIRLLKQAGIAVKLNCSVTPDNAHDLERMFAFAREEELILQATSYMFPPLRRDAAMVGRNDRFTPEEAAWQNARIVCQSWGEERFLEYMDAEESRSLPAEPGEDCPELPVEGGGMRCRAGRCSFWVTWDGRMLPCGMFPGEDAANVLDGDFAAQWQRVREQVAQIRLPAGCTACSLRDSCRACAAMVLTETGGFDRIPEYRCRMSKSVDDTCRTLARQLRRQKGERSQ